MLRFMSLSSGSCGNCYYLGTDNGGILIDAGVSLRRLKKALQEYELDTDSFSAVLVTHDHLDHIRHLGSFCKRLNKPVYTTGTIHSALARHTFTAPTISPCRRIMEGEGFVESFTTFQIVGDAGASTAVQATSGQKTDDQCCQNCLPIKILLLL